MGPTSGSGISRCSITVRSGSTIKPPLKAAMGVVIRRGSTSIDMPRGGRPLVMAKSTPCASSACTASTARGVSSFSFVTSVPSTSARRSRMGLSVMAGAVASGSGAQLVPVRTPRTKDPARV